MDRIESDEKLFTKYMQTFLSCISELNKIHKVQDQTPKDQRIKIILGRRDETMSDDTIDFE